jgi:hypothetical protein
MGLEKTVKSVSSPPPVYQLVIECRDEAQQRELFERLRQEGVKIRVLVL